MYVITVMYPSVQGTKQSMHNLNVAYDDDDNDDDRLWNWRCMTMDKPTHKLTNVLMIYDVMMTMMMMNWWW